MWAIDIQECGALELAQETMSRSVARGITSNSVQNRYLDMLESGFSCVFTSLI